MVQGFSLSIFRHRLNDKLGWGLGIELFFVLNTTASTKCGDSSFHGAFFGKIRRVVAIEVIDLVAS